MYDKITCSFSIKVDRSPVEYNEFSGVLNKVRFVTEIYVKKDFYTMYM